MPQVKHVCVLLYLVMPQVRHAYLDLHIGVGLKGGTTCIWSFGCGFAYATTIRYTGFKLLSSLSIVS